MPTLYTPRKAGEKMGLSHLEVIRRLRRGDIKGEKLGWNWIITEEAIEEAMKQEWYQRYADKHQNSSA